MVEPTTCIVPVIVVLPPTLNVSVKVVAPVTPIVPVKLVFPATLNVPSNSPSLNIRSPLVPVNTSLVFVASVKNVNLDVLSS